MKRWLALAVFIAALALNFPALLEGLGRNQAALAARSVCLGADPDALQPDGRAAGEIPWFAAIQAHCQGAVEQEEQAWVETLADSPERLPVVRAFRPEDLDLARQAVQIQPKDPFAWFWLGDVLAERGDLASAISAYQSGLALGPSSGEYWMRLGRLREDQGDWGSAVQAYDQACFYMDHGKNGCPNAGRLHMQLGEYDLALQRYQDTLEQLPGWPGGIRGLANALLELGRDEEALPYLEELAAQGDNQAQETLQKLRQDNK